MSQPTHSGSSNPLRRDRAATSSAYTSSTSQRRRIDDSEANWMDVDTSEDETEYTSDEEEDERRGASYDPQRPQHGRQTPPRNSGSSASLSSSSTLYEPGVRADKAHAGGKGRDGKKPLISYIVNDWQRKGGEYSDGDEKHPYYQNSYRYHPPSRRHDPEPACCDEILESHPWAGCLRVACSRVTWRLVAILVIIFVFVHTGHRWFDKGAQTYSSSGTLRQSVHLRLGGGSPRGIRGRTKSWFGTQSTTQFHGLKQLVSLEQTGWQWADGRKLIIIGDVHGCADPLDALLKKAKFNGDNDHLAFVGDLVAKGPETSRVLDTAMKHNASCVRGNHDDRLLLLYRDLQTPLQTIQSSDDTPMTGKQAHVSERQLAAQMTKPQMDYLASCPLVFEIGELKSLAPNSLIVHAGLVPGLPLDRQDPYAAMNMRSVDLRTHTPVKQHSPAVARELRDKVGGEEYNELPPPWDGKKSKVRVYDLDETYVMPWRQLWDEYQIGLPKEDRTLAIYGHDSRVGLVEGPWAIGLDSGCVNGGSLSALVFEMKGGKVRKKTVSVGCEGMKKGSKGKKERRERGS